MVMNNKAYFSNIRSEILSLLEHAEKEVLIAMAWFTSNAFLPTLVTLSGIVIFANELQP